MANMQHFYDGPDGAILLTGNIQAMRDAECAARFPGIRAKSYQRGYSRMVMFAPGRGNELFPVTRIIERKSNPSNHKCGPRCQNATGFQCECACKGKNHGAGNFVCLAA
jgi:hypothetical protein